MVPRLERHCSAVKSRNAQTVLSCDSPRSAADRGESSLKPFCVFLHTLAARFSTSRFHSCLLPTAGRGKRPRRAWTSAPTKVRLKIVESYHNLPVGLKVSVRPRGPVQCLW